MLISFSEQSLKSYGHFSDLGVVIALSHTGTAIHGLGEIHKVLLTLVTDRSLQKDAFTSPETDKILNQGNCIKGYLSPLIWYA